MQVAMLTASQQCGVVSPPQGRIGQVLAHTCWGLSLESENGTFTKNKIL